MATATARAITGLTTGISSVEKLNNVKNLADKAEYGYTHEQPFSKPVVITGTNKQFLPAEDTAVLPTASEEAFTTLIGTYKKRESGLDLISIPDFPSFNLVGVRDGSMLFFYNSTFYLMDTPVSTKSQLTVTDNALAKELDRKGGILPYKQIFSMLGIPYAFISKCSSDLSEAIITEWQTRLEKLPDTKDFGIDVAYSIEESEIDTTGFTFTKWAVDSGLTAEMIRPIHRILNVLKGKRERSGQGSAHVMGEKFTRLPHMSYIADQVKDQVLAIDPEYKVELQSYSDGFDGANKGVHFLRLNFNHPTGNIDFMGDTFFPSLTINADWAGSTSLKGKVSFTFGLLKLACTNGMVAVWSKDLKEKMKTHLVQAMMDHGSIEERRRGLQLYEDQSRGFL